MEIRKHKPTVQLLAAVLLIVVGCGLLIAAGAVFGMKYHYQYGHRPSDSQNQSHNPQEHDNH